MSSGKGILLVNFLQENSALTTSIWPVSQFTSGLKVMLRSQYVPVFV